MIFKERFLLLKQEKNVTQQDIANAIKINISSLSKIINGKASLKTDILNDLAKFFNVDKAYLLGETNKRKTKDILPDAYLEVCLNAIDKKISPETLQKLIDAIYSHHSLEND